MLGWVAAMIGIEAGHYFNSIFLAPHFWAIGWFLYEDYEKGFLCCQQVKRQGYRFAGYFVYGWLIIASLLPSLGYTGKLFISPVAAVVIFLLGV
jgi:protoheme IX farnesyltransferase